MTSSALVGWLAQEPPKPPQGPEFGGSSPIGLVVVLLLALALVFLIRSMNKHLRKVPKSFDDTDDQRPDEPATPTAPTGQAPADEEPNASNKTGGDQEGRS
jgi:hypothetical protein